MSPDLDLAAAEWVRSSYSDASGGNCVEFTRDFAWIKSSYSDANGGECLEFSRARTEPHGLVPVRDSKDPDGPALIFAAGDWSSFVSAIKRGQFSA
ncbi:protein of unknown function (DUF397) [Streptomyces sp. SceaMP-e96]|uniref:DUF397 domain-containing protein n=1 Tax=unclassified Streptomyces TaxID=2593676 RepID=UPI000823CF64|nr:MULTISPECIES: DUF397 domain-containing protein [unclassified Streptomyces]MYT12669.1 DUF397 domain-containing protein [Streptomyces sp. SID4951]SCK37896.1 protein of unknown function (DUF397) [Streptomyces sp. SceaMP-e96]